MSLYSKLFPKQIILFFIFLTSFYFSFSQARTKKLNIATETFSGTVVGITDGDTIKVLTENKILHKIRLYGVDAPEKNQAFGSVSKMFSSSLAFGKNVTIEVMDHDRYSREVSLVKLSDGTTLNEELIKSGNAWVYVHYCKVSFCDVWKSEEQSARDHKVGLWVDKDPIAPWLFRRGR
jgi:micrococcal nuclease